MGKIFIIIFCISQSAIIYGQKIKQHYSDFIFSMTNPYESCLLEVQVKNSGNGCLIIYKKPKDSLSIKKIIRIDSFTISSKLDFKKVDKQILAILDSPKIVNNAFPDRYKVIVTIDNTTKIETYDLTNSLYDILKIVFSYLNIKSENCDLLNRFIKKFPTNPAIRRVNKS